MAEKLPDLPRKNRTLSVADALSGALDPVLKKRGFASRDILIQWPSIAPPPFDRLTRPDKLNWPRQAQGAEGAVLHLRCAPGQALMVQHEAPAIAAAINRYFGYVLVGEVRLSAEPFTPGSAPRAHKKTEPSRASLDKIAAKTAAIEDEGLRAALSQLGRAMALRSERNSE
jgi:hypothetical protein